jgi:hypothetical protein
MLSVIISWFGGPMMRAALLIIALLFSQFSMAADEAKQVQFNAIPNQVRTVLGCDTKLRGNGIGLEGKTEEMLAGYSPASLNGRPKISIFWCALTEDKFLLAFVRSGRLSHPECSPILTWHYFPKGLSSLSTEPVPLDQFVYVDDLNRSWLDSFKVKPGASPPKRFGPPGEKTIGPIIVDGDDSLSNEFYCYKGAWLVRILD